MKSNARLPVERVTYTLTWKGHLRIGCDGYFGQGLSGFRFTRGCTVESEREQRLELIRTISVTREPSMNVPSPLQRQELAHGTFRPHKCREKL